VSHTLPQARRPGAVIPMRGDDSSGQIPSEILPDQAWWAHAELAAERYEELEIEVDPVDRAYWCYMNPAGRPSFTPTMLKSLRDMQRSIRRVCMQSPPNDMPLQFWILGSKAPGAFNLGGDLTLFAELIRRRDRAGLRKYTLDCIELIYNNANGLHLPLVTVALVQGEALGGGFEAALSCDVIVAERGARCGLPEILFNLFPGMGAYNLLLRRLDAQSAERMILSGRIYTAEELHKMGVIDILVEPGEGPAAVRDYITQTRRRHNAHNAVYRVRRRLNPLSYEELADIGEIWVDAALGLGEADLRKMDRLVSAQDRRKSGAKRP
jgi:DSF synthase